MEILSTESFRLITYQSLASDEEDVLTLLYHPILGSDAYALCQMLWSLIRRDRRKTPEFKHVFLYDALRFSPSRFLEARKKLEAIGLLDVYYNNEIYLYELKAPLSANEFIKGGSLGAILFAKVGEDMFNQLSELFRVFTKNKDGFKNITSTFDKVFQSLSKPIDTDLDFLTRKKANVKVNHAFDFDLFLDGLSKNYVDKRKITKSVKEKIVMLSYVYSLDEFTMQRVFMDSVDKQKNIDINALSVNARKWFRFDYRNIVRSEENNLKKIVHIEKVRELCKTERPLDILAILSGGKPSLQELSVVEKLLDNYDLPIPVINFLLVYVIGQVEDFPSYNYFDKVAISWQRKNIQTIDDAIQAIKERHKKVYRKKEKNQIPEDVESDWFEEYWNNR